MSETEVIELLGAERFARLRRGGWLVPESPGRPPVTKGPSPARRPSKGSRPLPAAFQRKFQLFERRFWQTYGQ
jgi:hypothetical protein